MEIEFNDYLVAQFGGFTAQSVQYPGFLICAEEQRWPCSSKQRTIVKSQLGGNLRASADMKQDSCDGLWGKLVQMVKEVKIKHRMAGGI